MNKERRSFTKSGNSHHFFILNFIHSELEKGNNKALRWLENGRAFEIRGRVRIYFMDRLPVVMTPGNLEGILLRYGFQKKEDVDSHIYFHRYFRRGENSLFSKILPSTREFYNYKSELLCPEGWEYNKLDLRGWYKNICDVYESTGNMLKIQGEIIETLSKEVTRLLGLGIEETKAPFVYRSSMIKGMTTLNFKENTKLRACSKSRVKKRRKLRSSESIEIVKMFKITDQREFT